MAMSLSRIFIIILFCFLVSAAVLYKLFFTVSYDPYAPMHMTISCNLANKDHPGCSKGRIAEYCASSIPVGSEGQFSGIGSEFYIHHVVLNVRHGDRSAIHSIPGATDLIKSEGSYIGRKDKADLKVVDALIAVRTVALRALGNQDSSRERVVGQAAASPLATIMTTPDRHLPPGQLTSHGFYQHVQLGEHLQRAYYSLLREPPAGPGALKVRSTNYNRTIQSAAALIVAMYPWAAPDGLVIDYYPNEHDEMMLGSLLKQRQQHSKGHGAEGETCGRAHQLRLQMTRAGYSPIQKETFNEIAAIFGLKRMAKFESRRVITDLVDAVLPRFCHGEHYQCGVDSRRCISHQLAERLMEEADGAFCEAYTSKIGGLDYTMLDIYPFMLEIRDALRQAAAQPAGSAKATARMHVFVGHDTVVAPVLTALGVYDHSEFCSWPNLASRIAFELWGRVKSEEWFVRVVYNGRDVTGFIPTCATVNTIVGSAFTEVHGYNSTKMGANTKFFLCPLQTFFMQIDNMLHPHESLAQACSNAA